VELQKKISRLIVIKTSSDLGSEMDAEGLELIMNNYQQIEDSNKLDRDHLNAAKGQNLQLQEQIKAANQACRRLQESRDKLQQ
jgi:hypothetical protein